MEAARPHPTIRLQNLAFPEADMSNAVTNISERLNLEMPYQFPLFTEVRAITPVDVAAAEHLLRYGAPEVRNALVINLMSLRRPHSSTPSGITAMYQDLVGKLDEKKAFCGLDLPNLKFQPPSQEGGMFNLWSLHSEISFDGLDMSGTNLSWACLESASFNGTVWTEVNLSGAQLRDVEILNTIITPGTNFSGVTVFSLRLDPPEWLNSDDVFHPDNVTWNTLKLSIDNMSRYPELKFSLAEQITEKHSSIIDYRFDGPIRFTS